MSFQEVINPGNNFFELVGGIINAEIYGRFNSHYSCYI